MKVSAVIPSYNRRTVVFRAIDSVLAQTLPADEIIVVDDGSTDGTVEAIRQRYDSQVIVVQQANSGVSAARSRGVKEARGDWVAFLDSDDEWLPTKLERQFEALGAVGGAVRACFTDCQFVENDEMVQTAFELGGLNKSGSFGILDDAVSYVLARHAVMYVQSLLADRALITELGGFDEAMTVSEDTDLFLRLALKTSICFVPETLVKIDRSPSRPVGLTELFSLKSDKVFLSQDHMYRKWLKLSEDLDPRERTEVEQRLRGLYYDWTIRKFYQLRLSEAFAKMKEIRKMGEGYSQILGTLAFRATRKISRPMVRARHSDTS